MSDVLLAPVTIGTLQAPNRILMAPLTRSRSKQPGDVPWRLNAEYYAQRASAGLIVSEATQVSPQGKGYAFTPGIHSDEQVAGWRLVTDAVHDAGGRIYLQLWHVGRISHTDLQPGNAKPVAPSAIRADSQTYTSNDSGMVQVSEPRALELDEIPGVVDQFRQGAQRAKDAGFDGVEVHGANGYLIDQFLRTGTNKRTDAYGGPVEHRTRFGVEVTKAVLDVWEPGRIGYRVSPLGDFNGMHDDDPKDTFGYLAEQLGSLGIAFIDVVEEFAGSGGRDDDANEAVFKEIRTRFKGAGGGAYLANGSYEADSARQRIGDGLADAVLFGKLFIANPDLPARIAQDGPYNDWDQSTFYGGDAAGYTDYPALSA